MPILECPYLGSAEMVEPLHFGGREGAVVDAYVVDGAVKEPTRRPIIIESANSQW